MSPRGINHHCCAKTSAVTADNVHMSRFENRSVQRGWIATVIPEP